MTTLELIKSRIMKTNHDMNMSELMNFNKEVVNYINDNLQYIKENAISCGNDDLADEALQHYITNTEATDNTEEILSEEQEREFYNVAKRLFSQGFVEHAGSINLENI